MIEVHDQGSMSDLMKLFRDITLGVFVGLSLALMLEFDIWPIGDQSLFRLGKSGAPDWLNYSD